MSPSPRPLPSKKKTYRKTESPHIRISSATKSNLSRTNPQITGMPGVSVSGPLLLAAVALTLLLISASVADAVPTCSGIVPMRYRNDKISIADFGGVGDGRTVNTKAFRAAIYRIQHLRRRGGTLLYIPPGVYLTGSFNLTSHMTLYLARGAVIKAVQVRSRSSTSAAPLRFRPHTTKCKNEQDSNFFFPI